jgi:hypothetical protein
LISTAATFERIKLMGDAIEAALKHERLVLDWRKKQQARAAVHIAIKEGRSELPDAYDSGPDYQRGLPGQLYTTPAPSGRRSVAGQVSSHVRRTMTLLHIGGMQVGLLVLPANCELCSHKYGAEGKRI